MIIFFLIRYPNAAKLDPPLFIFTCEIELSFSAMRQCLPLPCICSQAPPPHTLLQIPAGEWQQTEMTTDTLFRGAPVR